MLVIGVGIYKIVVKKANGEDPDQALHCLSRLGWQATAIVFEI